MKTMHKEVTHGAPAVMGRSSARKNKPSAQSECPDETGVDAASNADVRADGCIGRDGGERPAPSRATTKVLWNGSKCLGEEPDPLVVLEERLATHALDPCFEHYGDFAMCDAGDFFAHHGAPGGTLFFGNFLNISASFSVVTNDPAVITRLTDAVRANQARDDYREARPSVLAACNCETCRPDESEWRRCR